MTSDEVKFIRHQQQRCRQVARQILRPMFKRPVSPEERKVCDDLAEVLMAYEHAVQGWMPIELAPADVLVLVLLRDGGVCSARRFAVDETGELYWITDAGPHGMEFIKPWRQPTHWMRLPSIPETEANPPLPVR